MKRKFIRTLSLSLLTTALLLSKASAGSTPALCTKAAMDACIAGACITLGLAGCGDPAANANCGTTAMKSQVEKVLKLQNSKK